MRYLALVPASGNFLLRGKEESFILGGKFFQKLAEPQALLAPRSRDTRATCGYGFLCCSSGHHRPWNVQSQQQTVNLSKP